MPNGCECYGENKMPSMLGIARAVSGHRRDRELASSPKPGIQPLISLKTTAAAAAFATALTLSSNAWAVCTTNGTVVTCSGTTSNVGTAFGTGTEDNLTINVQTTA